MDINERIKSIGEYFGVFNIHEGTVCLGVVFPDKWTLFDVETICNEFDIQIQPKGEITYFLCDVSTGLDNVFNAVDFIIEQNKALQEKTELLRAKVDELRKLFENEPLERLKTLTFTFSEPIVGKDVVLPVDIKKQLKDTAVKKQETKVATEEEVVVPKKQGKRKNNKQDSPLMNFVKDALDNE